MKHAGILAHSTEGAALCFLAFCQEGFRRLGPHEHPDVTLDCIALARSMPAWDAGDYGPIRATLSVSANRLAAPVRTSSSAQTTPRTWRSENPARISPCPACISQGNSLTVTATPNGGHSFVHWTKNGAVVEASQSTPAPCRDTAHEPC
jgi:Divergent InlB B-repeat domain